MQLVLPVVRTGQGTATCDYFPSDLCTVDTDEFKAKPPPAALWFWGYTGLVFAAGLACGAVLTWITR
jgi:hypothetical protein